MIDNTTAAVSLDTATRKVQSDIRYAQNLASTTGEPHGFRVNSDNTYVIFKPNDMGAEEIVASPHDKNPMQIDIGEDYPGITFVSDNFPTNEILFDEIGRPTTGGGSNIIMQNNNSEQKTLSISNVTGKVDIL